MVKNLATAIAEDPKGKTVNDVSTDPTNPNCDDKDECETTVNLQGLTLDDDGMAIQGASVTVDVLANDVNADPESVRIIDNYGNEVTTLVVDGEGVWSVNIETGEITFNPEVNFSGDPTPINYTR